MKISELRDLLDRTSPEDMKCVLLEIYRALPRKTREQFAIDELLKNPAAVRGREKQTRIQAQRVDIGALEIEVEQFLIDAYAQHYFAPNRYVPKSERPKWRFKVKRLFREINAAVADRESIEKASALLEQLYKMLCYACEVYLFNAYDPFQSVGIEQTEFLDAVLALKTEHLELREFIDFGLHLVRDRTLNRYTLGSSLAQVLVHRLRTPESVEQAIEHAAQLHGQPHPAASRAQDYAACDRLNRLAEFGFLAYAKLSDYDSAIEFFKARYAAADQEVVLYVLLDRLRAFGQEDLWLREYERAIQAKIKPRDSLSKAYHYLKAHGALPAHY